MTFSVISVCSLPTRIQNELISSSSEKLPIWKFFIKKLFVFYLCLKENGAQCLMAAAYDCVFGPGAGSIFVNDYDYFVTFGPFVFIPLMTFITIILGLNGFTHGGFAIICSSLLIGMHRGPARRAELQAGLNPQVKDGGFLNNIIQFLIFMWFILFNGNVMKAGVFDPPTGVNSLVLSRKETCIQCSGEFSKVFIASKSICGCVCQSGNSERCYRTARDCDKCNLTEFTVDFVEIFRIITIVQILPMMLLFFKIASVELNCYEIFGIDTCIAVEYLVFLFQCLSYSTGAGIAIFVIIREGFRLLQRLHKIMKPEFPWLFSNNDSCANESSMPSHKPNYKSELAAMRETENIKESEPSVFESIMLKKLNELLERIEQQKVEMTNQKKEYVQQRETFNQKQDQIEGIIKQILNEQKNMNKQEKVLSQQQKVTLNNLEKMEEKHENNHEEVTIKQQELKKLCLDIRLSLNNQIKQQGLLQNLVLDLKTPNEKVENVAQSEAEPCNECKICMERPLNTVLKNCGHTMCFECAKMLKKGKKDCPTCREKIMGFQKIFL